MLFSYLLFIILIFQVCNLDFHLLLGAQDNFYFSRTSLCSQTLSSLRHSAFPNAFQIMILTCILKSQWILYWFHKVDCMIEFYYILINDLIMNIYWSDAFYLWSFHLYPCQNYCSHHYLTIRFLLFSYLIFRCLCL